MRRRGRSHREREDEPPSRGPSRGRARCVPLGPARPASATGTNTRPPRAMPAPPSASGVPGRRGPRRRRTSTGRQPTGHAPRGRRPASPGVPPNACGDSTRGPGPARTLGRPPASVTRAGSGRGRAHGTVEFVPAHLAPAAQPRRSAAEASRYPSVSRSSSRLAPSHRTSACRRAPGQVQQAAALGDDRPPPRANAATSARSAPFADSSPQVSRGSRRRLERARSFGSPSSDTGSKSPAPPRPRRAVRFSA